MTSDFVSEMQRRTAFALAETQRRALSRPGHTAADHR